MGEPWDWYWGALSQIRTKASWATSWASWGFFI